MNERTPSLRPPAFSMLPPAPRGTLIPSGGFGAPAPKTSLAPPRMPSLLPNGMMGPSLASLAALTQGHTALPPSEVRRTVAPPSQRITDVPPSRPSMPPASRHSQRPSKFASMAPTAIALAVATMTPACAVAAARNTDPPPAASMGTPFTLSQLEVTEGTLMEPTVGHFEVAEAKMRAVAAVPAGDAVDLHFAYDGPTEKSVALDSGEMRRQIGLKLRAQDGCNLIYVMWHIDPTPEIVVAVKSNPGQSKYEECGDRGYTTIKADFSAKVPKLVKGDTGTLSASIENGRLLVRVDGNAVWEGELDANARAMNGEMGVRSDNAKFSFQLVPGEPLKPAVWGAATKS